MANIVNVDGDILPYSCGFASEESTYETEDGEVHGTPTQAKAHIKANGLCDDIIKRTEAEPVSHALRLAKNLLLRVKATVKTKEMNVFLTGGREDGGVPNFRIAVGTIQPYKGNRVQPKPLHYQAIRDYLVKQWGATVCHGYEADDALGFNQTPDSCIATIDKDLNMIPGDHYNWDKGKYYHVTESEAISFFYHQLLTGDTTDNIMGLPGIGPAKAATALKGLVTEEDMFWKCMCMYEASGYARPHDALVENGKLLWIMRQENVQWKIPY